MYPFFQNVQSKCLAVSVQSSSFDFKKQEKQEIVKKKKTKKKKKKSLCPEYTYK